MDARQPTLFAAAWTLGSIKYLAEAGVDSLTYFETVGWLGVMEAEAGTPLPARFPSKAGGVFPIFHVLRDVGEFLGGQVRPVNSSDPLSVVGLWLEKGQQRMLLLANLSGRQQSVKVRSHVRRFRLRRLDADNLATAIDSPENFGRETTELKGESGALRLELAPHAIARLDAR